MKINFIRHISDDILKENQELKNTIIQTKLTLKNYQTEILNFLKSTNVNSPILDTPLDTLKLFIKHVTAQIEKHEANSERNQENSKLLAIANQKVNELSEELKHRKNEEEFRQKKWRQGLLAAENLQSEMKQQIEQLKLQNEEVKKEVELTVERHKIESLLFVENKRKELEDTRLYYHNKMMAQRDRLQEEHVLAYRKIKQDMQALEKKNKDLEKTIVKLVSNIKLEQSEIQILQELIATLQESLKASQSIQSMRDQIFDLKRQLKLAEKQRIESQSKLTEFQIKKQNYLSQIQRQKLEHHQFESRLSKKIKEMEQSQKDKEAMEDYYNNKWNQQFSKVRQNLERQYNIKLDHALRQYNKKVEECDQRMRENDLATEKFRKRNKQLEVIFENDKSTKAQLKKMLDQERSKLQEKQAQLEESWMMSRQQLISSKDKFDQQQFKLNEELIKLQKQLISREKKYEIITNQFNSELHRLVSEAKTEVTLQMKDKIFKLQQEKSHASEVHSLQIKRLSEDQQILLKRLKTIKDEINQECDRKIEALNCLNESKIKAKEEQASNKVEKAHNKQKEVELKLSNQKKQFDDEKNHLMREMLRFERQSASLVKINDSLEKQLGYEQGNKAVLRKEKKILQEEMHKMHKIIKDKDQEVRESKKYAQQAFLDMKVYKDQQVHWEGQLTRLKDQLRSDFEKLKAIAKEQQKRYKSKIWYLEQKLKNPVMTQKNYQKLQTLQNQKEELKVLVDQKQAQNIALSQVKDYFQVRFMESESKKSEGQIKNKIIYNRKFSHSRKQSCNVRPQTNRYTEDCKNVQQMKKYITQHQKRQNWAAGGRNKYGDHSFFERMKTNPC